MTSYGPDGGYLYPFYTHSDYKPTTPLVYDTTHLNGGGISRPTPHYAFTPSATTPFHAPATSLQPSPPTHRKKSYRSGTPAPYPLKSALKRPVPDPTLAPDPPVRTQRIRPNLDRPEAIVRPEAMARPEAMIRQRTHSNPKFPNSTAENLATHIFLSFHGGNEMRLENLMEFGRREMKEHVLPQWKEGVESDELQNYRWRIFFKKNPWRSRGSDEASVGRLIVQFFELCAFRGYEYQTSIDVGTQVPRLLFVGPVDCSHVQFFCGFFSRSGRQLTLIAPPPAVDIGLGQELKQLFPNISSDRSTDNSVRIIELKRNTFGAPEMQTGMFLTYVLKIILRHGYQLHATVPLPPRIPLGIGSRREYFVFRSMIQR